MPKVTATIQARMGSSRLPGKVLKRIGGKPLLWYQVQRIKQSLLVDEVVIATSTAPADDAIAGFAGRYRLPCFRGSEDDVLSRIVGALHWRKAELHAEFMGDNPIPDARLVDSLIGYYLKYADSLDLVTNAIKTTFPPGFEVFVYPARVLYAAERIARPELREHVCLNIYSRPDQFRIANIEAPAPLRDAAKFHFEVDTQEDWGVMSAVIRSLFPRDPCFTMNEAVAFLRRHPELHEKNAHVPRRWERFRKK